MVSSSSEDSPANTGKSEISEWSSLSVTPYSGVLSGSRAGARILAHIIPYERWPASFERPALGVEINKSVRHRLCGLLRIVVLIDVRIVGASDFQNAGKAPLDTAERVIDQHELSRHFKREVHDSRAAWRHCSGLHVSHWRSDQRTEVVHAIEHLTDDMER